MGAKMAVDFVDNEFGKFAKATDDSGHSELYAEADVILLGVSGVGKSVICNELAKSGLKAANIPIVSWIDIDTKALKSITDRGKPVVVYLACHKKEVIARRLTTGRYTTVSRSENKDAVDGKKHSINEHEVLKDLYRGNDLCQEIGGVRLDITRLSRQEAAESIIKLIHAPKPAELKKTQKKHQEYTP
jgi:regulator of PEP synthase PpsR (kinase-PPPase family)